MRRKSVIMENIVNIQRSISIFSAQDPFGTDRDITVAKPVSTNPNYNFPLTRWSCNERSPQEHTEFSLMKIRQKKRKTVHICGQLVWSVVLVLWCSSEIFVTTLGYAMCTYHKTTSLFHLTEIYTFTLNHRSRKIHDNWNI